MSSSNLAHPSMPLTTMPIFPLQMFILPNGRQKLRIFEAKYLTMVTQSLDGSGFVIALPYSYLSDDKNVSLEIEKKAVKQSPVSHWGTLVKVVDFDQGEDGVLLIDVEGQFLVSLQGFSYQEDGLLQGECLPRQHWPLSPEVSKKPPKPILAATLKELFYQYQDLNLLYPIPHFESAQWVNARLLEILPVPYKVKANFIQPDSFSALTTFLMTYIQGKKE